MQTQTPGPFPETCHGGAYIFNGACDVAAKDRRVRLDVEIALLDLPIDRVRGKGTVANHDLVKGRGGDWPRDDLELGFGVGDDGCVVGHDEGC